MLEYQWGNAVDETTQDSDQNPQIFDHYHNLFNNQNAFFNQPQQTHVDHNNINALFDPQNYVGTTSYPPLDNTGAGGGGGGGYLVVPKSEEVSRIGLNLGGRTYFSNDDDFVNRLYRRSRPVDTGSVNLPRCQAEGCNADLSHAKHYHRRHKVCEFHSKASTAIVAGLTQRFCQQCSRFHLLSAFDNGKRSCRKRLADHNRRRRKSHQPVEENQKSQLENTPSSSSDNLARSPPDSGAHPTSSVTVAISPSQISFDCFRQRPYQATSSPASSSSVFYSSG